MRSLLKHEPQGNTPVATPTGIPKCTLIRGVRLVRNVSLRPLGAFWEERTTGHPQAEEPGRFPPRATAEGFREPHRRQRGWSPEVSGRKVPRYHSFCERNTPGRAGGGELTDTGETPTRSIPVSKRNDVLGQSNIREQARPVTRRG